ncbi:MAG: hypothetical protein WBC85_10885 [Planktotalea sp.]|uniref:hypothetical protein n=1 Tax=Planktotalea sp. TaxID=2029877 RepID=UPI003C70F395
MAARERPAIAMHVALSILQLDTAFPRVPGDVGCPETYQGEVEIIRIPAATVSKIVTDRPDNIDITPFETALKRAKGDVIATSCGFLSYWQTHLAAQTDRPFVSSSLIALADLGARYQPEELMILTFDATRLGTRHLGTRADYATSIIGLPETCHLRDVISNNRAELDQVRASAEICAHVAAQIKPSHKHILLECTNLPPYKAALIQRTGLPITDILSVIETRRAGIVRSAFL